MTDFKYPTASLDKKRPKMRETCRHLGVSTVKRPLETILMLVLVVAGILAAVVIVAAVKIWSFR